MTNHAYIVTQQIFSEMKTLFRLEQVGKSSFIEKTAEEISLDRALIQSLNSEDAHLIGYVYASEKALSDISMLNKNRYPSSDRNTNNYSPISLSH